MPDSTVMAMIPAYNEGRHLGPVVKEAGTHVSVLVIDDGSKDNTAEVAKMAGAEVHTQVPNQGKGVALQTGFRMCMERGAQGILTLDADGQHDPSEIPKFLKSFESGPDLIIGARDFSKMPPVRRLSNSFARKTFSWAMGQEIQDNQSGYRLISSRLARAMLESDETGFEFEVEMIAVCIERGWRLAWVPIRTIYGDETSHIDPVTHVIEFLRIVLNTRKRMHK